MSEEKKHTREQAEIIGKRPASMPSIADLKELRSLSYKKSLFWNRKRKALCIKCKKTRYFQVQNKGNVCWECKRA